jgi:purine-nucleoside phosphorylase
MGKKEREMLEMIAEAADFLKSKVKVAPRVGLVTGTGLGDVIRDVKVDVRLSYEEVPHFARSTTAGHRGTLAFGRLAECPVVAMEGRFHLYEGYSPQEITLPIRVMSKLGVKILMIFSAAGGLNPGFEPGDAMMATDHINLTARNPLIGTNLDEFGPRFPDMSCVYDRELMAIAREEALKGGILLREGVYAGILGPSLETPAETRFLRMIGADAVGMSTVLEVIAAVHSGLRVILIAAITNVNLPDCMKGISLEEVIANANKAGAKVAPLLKKVIAKLPG